MHRHVPAVALTAVLFSSALHAQQATDLDRVVVSESTSRIPNSEAALPNTITVIDQVELQQQLAVTQDLSQVLANLIPAFSPPRQKMTSSGESVRGRQSLYMVDGVPQSTPLRDGARDAHTIDPAMIERIEVIHGANALQGIGASGGIINIITKRAPRKQGETFHEVILGASTAMPGEEDGTGYRGSYLFGSNAGAWDFVGGLSYAQEGLYYDAEGNSIAPEPVQGDLMDANSRNMFAKAGWAIDDQRRLQLSANHYRLEGEGHYAVVDGDYRLGIPASATPGDQPLEPPQNESSSASLDYRDNDLAGGQFQGQLFWTRFEGRYGSNAYVDFFNTGSDEIWYDQSQINAEKLGGKFTWSRGWIADLPLRLTLGLDLIRDTTEQRQLASGLGWVPPTTYQSVSPLVQAEYRLGPVLVTGGVRHERAKLDVDDFVTLPQYGTQFVEGGSPEFSETLPNLGVVWEAGSALKFYASYAEGYSVADIGRVLRAVDEPGQRVETLVSLTPVIADNREIGLDYDDGRWLVHLAAYRSDSDFGSRLAFNTATGSYEVKREATEIEGFEGSLGFQLNEAARLGVAYAEADGRYDSNADGILDSDLPGANISPDRATAYWQHQWLPNLSTRVQASHSDDREFKTRGVVDSRFKGYTTFDLQATVGLPVGTLALGIENLFDRQYIHYSSQVRPSDEDYFAGRGRVFSASWSHRF
ncbi:TonB-dependent receptor [Novilysobacter spongiicola]|uniref:Iron complex outermembrane recepter protein n=1 Tax=Lysobacter spongiicola DSM 21749 TaxID=1122188 RepID=A0A1T4REB3_9GAMM|nr:TonB-dependent receptor [Lysobacter spongiicola]SKA14370.1 iron complex outermembrane recepter protein [Lysobacter spongiicola DSM 21749]